MKSSESLKACIWQSKHVLYKRISSRIKPILCSTITFECNSISFIVQQNMIIPFWHRFPTSLLHKNCLYSIFADGLHHHHTVPLFTLNIIFISVVYFPEKTDILFESRQAFAKSSRWLSQVWRKMLFPIKLLSEMLFLIIFPHDGKGCAVMSSKLC